MSEPQKNGPGKWRSVKLDISGAPGKDLPNLLSRADGILDSHALQGLVVPRNFTSP